jgi:hypothetical protein
MEVAWAGSNVARRSESKQGFDVVIRFRDAENPTVPLHTRQDHPLPPVGSEEATESVLVS